MRKSILCHKRVPEQVLGGLQENSITESDSYFPIIGRWPLIRNLFGTDSDDYTKTEIIIFIRPKVLRNPTQAGEFATQYIEDKLESTSVREYLETGTTGNIYMEGSKFEKEAKKKAKAAKIVEAENEVVVESTAKTIEPETATLMAPTAGAEELSKQQEPTPAP